MKILSFIVLATSTYGFAQFYAAHDFEKNDQSPPDYEKALFQAAKTNNVQNISDILATGLDPHVRSDSGNTALHFAAYYGGAETTEALINKGCPVNVQNDKGETPLLLSTCQNFPDVGKLLIAAGASINESDYEGVTPLMLAARSDKTGTLVQLLLDNQADVTLRDKDEQTALHYALDEGTPVVIEMLVQHLIQNHGVEIKTYIKKLYSAREEKINAFLKHLLPNDQKRIRYLLKQYWLPAYTWELSYILGTVGIMFVLPGLLGVGCCSRPFDHMKY